MDEAQSNIDYESFNRICRVCLKRGNLRPFKSLLYAFYRSLTRIPKDKNVVLPKNICKKCEQYLEEISSFIDKCSDQEIKLKETYYLKMKSVKFDKSNNNDCYSNCNDDSTVKIKQQLNVPKQEIIRIEIDGVENQIIIENYSDEEKLLESHDIFKPKLPDIVESGRLFKCNYCNMTFTVPSRLKVHLKRHMGIKPYECEHCSKSFVIKSDLNRHLLIHNEEKRYKCSKCDGSFHLRFNYVRHLENHDKFENLVCKICGKGFVNILNLKRHLVFCNAKVMYKCEVCDNEFRHKCNLVRHMNGHNCYRER